MVYTYEGDTDEGTETTIIEVLEAKREVMGVMCTIVHDTVSIDGEVLEDTYDWYAQDTDGNVWYFGEASMEIVEGRFDSAFGSWEGGVDCAEPGIVMLASPAIGDVYRQEFYQCKAEDMAEILSMGESITVPYGAFTNCLRTHDFTPLDAEVNENKVYAPGIGLVAAFDDGEPAEQLVSIESR